MKKVIISLSLCLMIAFSCMFVGCDEKQDEFWVSTNEVLNEFIKNDVSNYKNNGYDWGSIVETNIDLNYEGYSDLRNVYLLVFQMSFGFMEQYSGILSVTPVNKNEQIKKSFASFENQIKDIKKELLNFKTNVTTFKNGVEGSTQQQAESIISQNYLKNFKRQFIDLSSDLLDVSDSFLKLYISAYGDMPTLYNNNNYAELSLSQKQIFTKLSLSQSIVKTLEPTIKFINSYDGKYSHYENDNTLKCLTYYKSLISNTSSVATVEKLYNWQNSFSAYKNELKNFYTALDNVNMYVLYNEYDYDTLAYSTNNENVDSQKLTCANDILTFVEKGVQSLKNVVATIYA